MELDEPGLQNCFSLSGWMKIIESILVFTCLMLHRIGDDGSQVWFGASDEKLDQSDPNYEAEVDTEIIGGALMAYTIITPLILLAYAVEGTDRIHRTSLDVLFSITGAFALIALGGMTCFAWRHANRNNVRLKRSDFVSAGFLGVLSALTGCLYLADTVWLFYRKALLGDYEEDGSFQGSGVVVVEDFGPPRFTSSSPPPPVPQRQQKHPPPPPDRSERIFNVSDHYF